MLVDNLIALNILSRLVTPFKDTDAFKLGIIDENGKLLKKSADLKTLAEKNAFTMLDRMVFNLKRILAKLPGGETKLANIAAAYFLIKENAQLKLDDYQEIYEYFEADVKHIASNSVLMVEETLEIIRFLREDAPTNSTGPAVSSDEPVINRQKKKLFIKRKGTANGIL